MGCFCEWKEGGGGKLNRWCMFKINLCVGKKDKVVEAWQHNKIVDWT